MVPLRINTLVLFLGDIGIFFMGLIVALMLRNRAIPERETVFAHLEAFVGVCLVWLIVFLIAGLYDARVNFSRKLIPGIVMRAQAVNLALAAVLFFILPLGITPKITLALYVGVTTGMIVWWRLFVFPLFAASHTERLLIVGSSKEAEEVYRLMRENALFRFASATRLDPTMHKQTAFAVHALNHAVHSKNVTMIVSDIANDGHDGALIPALYNLAFVRGGISYMPLHTLYEQIFHRIPPSLVHESWMLENVSLAPHAFDDVIKRFFDFSLACLLCAFLLPLFPLIALLVKREDGGRVLYTTERIGQFNKPITIYKFRTMNGADAGNAALKSSLRVTRIGRMLRASRLDELPQLINILKGDLSFIGPRPEMPALVSVYTEKIPYYTMRHLVKPGLSGWAQINDFDVPRSGIDVPRTEAKLSFDLYYLKHRSPFLDIEIALKTIKTLLFRTGT
jgi:exopolysaccharide biosynthesis polyprenyl glycosylphosphotransferase